MIIQYEKQLIEMSDEFSFSKGNPLDIPDGANVYASVFSSEIPDTEIFRPDMTGVTFYNCNLDNVIIPPGNTVIGGTQRRFKVQNDGNDWLIDEEDKPTLPMNHKYFTKTKLPMPHPKDIPKDNMLVDYTSEPVDLVKKAKEKLTNETINI